MSQDRMREIPPVSAILEHAQIAPLLKGRRKAWLTRLIQAQLAQLRQDLRTAKGPVLNREQLLKQSVQSIVDKVDSLTQKSWNRVINGTGVVVHTNLGRSCYPAQAAEWAQQVALHNSDLEFDLQTGLRGHRGREVEEKAALLAGAEDALIVNNNAAAVWLAVRHLSAGGRVLLSRGEVVAIGGSFRIHDILAETGCTLVEVGTTNRTSVEDYRQAIEPGTTVLKVHRSNYDVQGFTEEVSLAELGQLCAETGAHLVYDAGSGALFPFGELGLPDTETELNEDMATGAHLVTCSGDKLLGGCQAGIILGSGQQIARLRKHPMRRAFRVGKTTLAALDAVLSLYLAAEELPEVPTLQQLAQTLDQLTDRAEGMLTALREFAPADWQGQVASGESSVGGGTFSTSSVESRLLLWTGPKDALETCHQLLRQGNPALVGRMNQDGLAVDVRTIKIEEVPLVEAAFKTAWKTMAG